MSFTIAAHAAAQAYGYPLLIKQLLHTTPSPRPASKKLSAPTAFYTYADFYQRVRGWPSAPTTLGVGMGDTVAVMDWDSHRYLESYFAVPMMGSVLFNECAPVGRPDHLHHEPRPAQGAAGECRIPAGVQRHPRPAGIGGTRHPAQRRRAAGRRRAGHGRRIRSAAGRQPGAV